MFKRLSQLVSIAVIVAFASCAHKPMNYAENLGQPEATADGKFKALPGERVVAREQVTPGYSAAPSVNEPVKIGRAMGFVEHKRLDKRTGKYRTLGTDTVYNVKTTSGIDFVFAQAYSTSPGANGLNYIECSNDSLTETSASTAITNPITTNGLARAIGTYAHTAGQSTATISKTFTASGNQSVQKCALVSAASSGTTTHILAFTQRSLISGDTLTITFTITISELELFIPFRFAANDNAEERWARAAEYFGKVAA